MLTGDFAADGKTELLAAISARYAYNTLKMVSNWLSDARTERFQVSLVLRTRGVDDALSFSSLALGKL